MDGSLIRVHVRDHTTKTESGYKLELSLSINLVLEPSLRIPVLEPSLRIPVLEPSLGTRIQTSDSESWNPARMTVRSAGANAYWILVSYP